MKGKIKVECSLISIVIPTYNSDKYIEQCLNSICNQTYKNIEIIVVNDGSTDSTKDIVKKIQKKDSRIILINQENSGASVARNNGINYSKGQYILFFDSDDILKEDALEIMYNEMINNNVDLILSNFEIYGNNETNRFNVPLLDKVYSEECIFECAKLSPYPGTKLYNNAIIKKNDLKFANVRIGQDLNFFLKYLLYANKIKTISKTLVYYRLSENGMSRTYSYKILDIVNSFENIKKAYIKENKIDIYNNYIAIIEIIHYGLQMNKVRFFENKIDRKIIVLYFKRYIKSVNFSWNEFTSKFKKDYLKIRLKIIFKNLFISNIYCKRRR